MNYENEIETGAIALVCNGLGFALNQSPAPNWVIPFALPIAGAIAGCGLDGLSGHAAIKGLIAGFSAVGMNQALRNGKEAVTPKSEPQQPKP